MIGNNAVCYEAIQRCLRNRVVDYLRIRMTELFPQDHIEKLKKPIEKEWDTLVANADACRQSGGTETKVCDEYDLLSVGHFFALFDVYFDKMYSAAALAAKSYRKPTKAKLLGNLKAIKDFRDPLSHPVSEEVSFEEAFGVLSDVKQILESLGFPEDAMEVSRLMQQLHGLDSHEASKMVCSLPTQDSIYLDFVGRQQVLAALGDWFSSRTNKRCLLAGDGGKGKSAVAYKFAQDLSQSDTEFKMVAWLSAKRRKFEEGKVVLIDAPDFADLESALDRLLAHYGFLPEKLDLPEKKSEVLQLLNDYPAFLIVDDIDTVLSDTEVVGLFTFEIPSTRSVVLLTSRREIPGIKKFDILGFELTETRDFVRSRVELYGLVPELFPVSLAEELQRVTDGSPLYMDDLLRLARILPIDKAMAMWADKQGDEARKYALQRELERLSKDARKVLIAASVGDDPVSFAEIESILEISEERILVALTELQTLFLIPKPKVLEGEQRFELNSNTRKLVRLVEGGTDQFGRIETKAKAIHGELPDVGRGLVAALIRQAFLLLNSGKHQEAEQLLLQAADKYPQAADVQGFIGFLYRRLERFTDAARHFEAAHKLKCTSRDAYRHWVKMEMSLKEWTRAIAAADKGLRAIPNFYELHALRAECKLRSGHDFAARLQREKAVKLWAETADELVKIIKPPDKLRQGERTSSAYMYNVLIICLDLLGDYRALHTHFQAWSREHPDDPKVKYQLEFIEQKHGRTLDELSWQKPRMQTSSHTRIDR
jgi:tetratricopeptide (TPR) repeat protein